MAGDVRDHHLVALPPARLGEPAEHCDRHPAGGLGEHPLGAGEQLHRVEDLVVADARDHSPALASGADDVLSVGGAADGEGARDRVRAPDRRDRVVAGEGIGDRRAAGGLGTGEPGVGRPVDQAEVDQLAYRLLRLDELGAGGDRDHDLVGEAPAQLLDGLVGEGLASLAVEGPDVDVAEGPGDLVGQLAAQPVGVVVGAVDPHQGGAEHRGGGDLGGLQVGRDDDHGAHRGMGGVGGDGVGQVAGAGTGDGVEAVAAGPAGGDAHHPVLEGVGRVLGVVLQVEVAQPEQVAQVAGADERRPALAQGDRLHVVLDGQEVVVAPDARRPRLDALPGDPPADLGVVIGDLEGAEAVVAGVGGRDRGGVAAGAAAQGKYSLAHVMDLRFRRMSDHACGAVRPPRRIRIPANPWAPRGGSGRVEGV